MAIFIGDPIDLSIRFSIDGIPQSGRTITTRVVRQSNGVEVLSVTPTPETTETGLYTFVWTTPPASPIGLVAIYLDSGSGKTFVEFIKINMPIVAKGGLATPGIDGVVVDDDALTGVVSSDSVIGVVGTDEIVSTVVDQSITGTVADLDIIGTLNTSETTGVVDC